jgi:hypothetical protein
VPWQTAFRDITLPVPVLPGAIGLPEQRFRVAETSLMRRVGSGGSPPEQR